MHACSQKVGVILAADKILKSNYCVLHSLFKFDWGRERFVWLHLDDMQLKFFAEAEMRQFHRVDCSAVKVFENSVNDWQRFQFIVD
jgi:hypothetical protein